MEEKKNLVKEFMTTPIVTLPSHFLLEQAERVFNEHRLTAAPVVLDLKSVLGVITDFKLLKCFLIQTTNSMKSRLQDFAEEFDPVVLIDENEDISIVFKLMLQSPNHRIFVTSNDKLVGALSPKDLLPYFAGVDAIDRHSEHMDLIAAKIKIRKLMSELVSAKEHLSNYQQAFVASPFMIHSSDLQGNITMANPMLHHVLGYKDNELIGKKITDIYASQFHKQAISGLEKVKMDGFHPLIHTLMVRKNKELLQVDLASAAKKGPAGEVDGTITIGRMSDSGKMIEALARIGEAFRAQK